MDRVSKPSPLKLIPLTEMNTTRAQWRAEQVYLVWVAVVVEWRNPSGSARVVPVSGNGYHPSFQSDIVDYSDAAGDDDDDDDDEGDEDDIEDEEEEEEEVVPPRSERRSKLVHDPSQRISRLTSASTRDKVHTK